MKELIDIAEKAQRRKYPNIPDHALPKIKYSDRTANGLTKCIIDFLRLQGWQAERISTTGRYLDESKTYIDVLVIHASLALANGYQHQARKEVQTYPQR